MKNVIFQFTFDCLEKCDWNKTHTAKMMGVSIKTLYNYLADMQKYDWEPNAPEPEEIILEPEMPITEGEPIEPYCPSSPFEINMEVGPRIYDFHGMATNEQRLAYADNPRLKGHFA